MGLQHLSPVISHISTCSEDGIGLNIIEQAQLIYVYRRRIAGHQAHTTAYLRERQLDLIRLPDRFEGKDMTAAFLPLIFPKDLVDKVKESLGDTRIEECKTVIEKL